MMNQNKIKRPAILGDLSIRITGTELLIILALLAFEIFSYSSNVTAFAGWWGSGLNWGPVLAFALIAVDFGGVARNSDPDFAKSDAAQWLWIAWSLSAFFDGFLTFVAVSMNNHSSSLVVAGRISLWFWNYGRPLMIAVFVTFIQILLVHRMEKALARTAGGGGGNAKRK